MPSRHRKPLIVPPHSDVGCRIRHRTITAPDGTILREPTIEAAHWTGPASDDGKPTGIVSGASVADPLVAMHLRSGLITARHLRAADMLRDDWELGMAGAKPGIERGAAVGGGFTARQYPSEARIDRMQNARLALQSVGRMGTTLLLHVVLGIPDSERRCVRSYSARHHLEEKTVRGMLIICLDRLAEHYSPPDDYLVSVVIAAAIRAAA